VDCVIDADCDANFTCNASNVCEYNPCDATLSSIANHPYDFEGCSNDGWTLSGAEWEVGSNTTVKTPYQGSCMMATDLDSNYNDDQNGTATSPTIDLSGCSGETVYLKWYMTYNIETDYDYLYVDISTNGGSNWTNGVATYTGNVGNWTLNSVNVSSYLTSSFKMRFRFTSDSSYNYIGPYVDYVYFTK
jgi:hypothetical protein